MLFIYIGTIAAIVAFVWVLKKFDGKQIHYNGLLVLTAALVLCGLYYIIPDLGIERYYLFLSSAGTLTVYAAYKWIMFPKVIESYSGSTNFGSLVIPLAHFVLTLVPLTVLTIVGWIIVSRF